MNDCQVAGERSTTETTLPLPIVLYSLGIVPYEPALEIQEQLRQARVKDEIDDALIVLQHPPVITVGVSGGMEDLHVSTTQLDSMGVELYETSRGGKATFHGPGQLVAYPVMKLPDRDLHTYLWRLEESIIRTLASWDIQAGRDEHHPGVWVGDRKICAVGISVRDDVTMHGLALNANTDLEYFNLFTPCGIADRSVTSMEILLGHSIDMVELEISFLRAFADVYKRPIFIRQETSFSNLSG